jgi:uncharacterized membrane protein
MRFEDEESGDTTSPIWLLPQTAYLNCFISGLVVDFIITLVMRIPNCPKGKGAELKY